MRWATLALVVTSLAACSDQASHRMPTPPDESGVEAVTLPSEGTGTAHRHAADSTAADDPGDDTRPNPTAALGEDEPSLTEDDGISDAEPTPAPPPDIFAIMLEAGWTLQSDQDLADYLPVPPGTDGQVGRFTRGEESLSIARVTYPAAIHANPHEQWIRERMALLPDAHERVVRRDATVIHIIADSVACADEVAALFAGGDQAEPAGRREDSHD